MQDRRGTHAVREASTEDLEVLEEVYLEAFPPAERDPWEDLVAGHLAGECTVLAAHWGGRAVGLATLELLSDIDAAALGYLAVARDVRGGGIGGRLFDEVVRRAAGTAGVVLEVERVAEAADRQDADLRRRRLGFYARHGAHVVETIPGYGMPDATTGELVPMHLLWRPTREGAMVDPTRLVEVVHAAFYGLLPSDPRTAAVLAGIQN